MLIFSDKQYHFSETGAQQIHNTMCSLMTQHLVGTNDQIRVALSIARPDIVTGNTNQRIIPYGFHTGFEFIKIFVCLINSKIFIGVKPGIF